jgi:hypothetical protein
VPLIRSFSQRKWRLSDDPIKEEDDEDDEVYGNLKLMENRAKVLSQQGVRGSSRSAWHGR